MGNTGELIPLPTSKELDAEEEAEEKERIQHEQSITEIYKLNSQDINYFKILNDLKNKEMVKNYFVKSFLSFIGDRPFLVYSKDSMSSHNFPKILGDRAGQMIFMDCIKNAEFSLSNERFSFEILMKVYPSLGVKKNNIKKLIMSSGSIESFVMEDYLTNSISNFSSKNIEDNVLTLETGWSPLHFYNSDHKLVKSANKFILNKAPYLLKKENAWNKPYFV